MANIVYGNITVENKYKAKLEEISKVGLCRYYIPMPKVLEGTSAPTTIVTEKEYEEQMEKNKTSKGDYKPKPLTFDMHTSLVSRTGYDNWYDWSVDNWGTKWGTKFESYEDGVYWFETAYSPVRGKIIEMLMKDIPTFTYHFIEEFGWGASYEIKDGKVVSTETRGED
ncbi:hypothetical protein N9P00_02500 [Flavobacteriaceae bacterium]|jgi:hypothetical protein|nr:hypothetical protein [Flavobacteriaceae bacterium]